MAEKLLSSINKSVASQLAGPFETSVGSSWNWAYNPKEDVEELRRMVVRIRATLDDAEERDVEDAAVKLWLEELQDLAYDAEDIVDEYDYEVLRSKVEAQNKIETTHKRKRKEVCNLITSTVSISYNFEARIKRIWEKFDWITKDRDALRLTEEDGEKLSHKIAKLPPTTSFACDSDVYGREHDKEKVIEWLMAKDDSSRQSVSVLPIIGMGGIGKTALAQLVYNDTRVCQYFSQRGWVCVSENFDVSRLLKEIFESLTKEPCNQMNMDVVCDNLRRQLNGNRFLLILDDVWNEKLSLWQSLKSSLSNVGIGKIIVTTRNEGVATIMQTSQLVHRLDFLPEDICWSLFWNLALEGRVEDEYSNVAEIGRAIVRKCQGLPLALRTLGGLLRFEAEKERWTDVLESELWELKDDILPALKLSYDRMPAHIKRCFVYCSMFPKDYKFQKDHIVKLWISQGLIQSSGRQRVEDIGNSYFEVLIQRSFFQKAYFSGECNVHMHDLLHDLALSIAKEECYSMETMVPNMPKGVRHLSFHFRSNSFCTENFLEHLSKCTDLRTLHLTSSSVFDHRFVIQNNLFHSLTHLRAFYFSGGCRNLADSVGNLKHLRYLGLRDTGIRRLPDSICFLYNLLALEVDCFCLEELPKDMKNLINLRHLDIQNRIICLPPGIRQISSLQTLSSFKVGKTDQHCGIGELKDLVHLRGRLAIGGLENLASSEDAKEAKMDNKEHLESLEFWWSMGQEDEKMISRVANLQGLTYDEYLEQTLENLRPHAHLKELQIWQYGGSRLPSWLGDPSFSELVKVVLIGFGPRFAFLPPLGRLPSLKHLDIRGMVGVRSVGRQFHGNDTMMAIAFPSLETLRFTNMPEWVEWDGVDAGDFPRLQTLKIEICHKLTSIPASLPSSLKKLRIRECRDLGALPILPSLTTLTLGSNKLYSTISSSNLPALQSLKVLKLDLRNLILRCGRFPLLRELILRNCRKLASIQGMQSVTSLERLVLENCPNLHFFVDDERLPPTLQCVEVRCCPRLRKWCKSQGIQYQRIIVRKDIHIEDLKGDDDNE